MNQTQKKKWLMVFGLAASMVGFGGTAISAPITLGTPGESILGSGNTGNDFLTVDWLVESYDGQNGGGTYGLLNGNAGTGLFAYYYQVESVPGNSTSGPDDFSVSVFERSVVDAGVLGTDKDLHVGTVDPSVASTSIDTSLGLNTVSWTFASILPINSASSIMWFLNTLPPTYGDGVASDSIPPSPWDTLPHATGTDGTQIPVPAAPVPEPTTFLFGALGLGAVALYARRKKNLTSPCLS
jgi:hypothetical protein